MAMQVRRVMMCGMLLGAMFIMTGLLNAEEAEKPKSSVPEGPVDMILASGTIGYLLCLLSVVATGMVIENLMSLKREKLMPDDLLEEINGAIDEGNYEGALEVCQNQDCMMTRVIGAGLNKLSFGIERVAEAIGEEADAQATNLNQRLGYINLIAATAPSIGLLGTVSGMVGAFGEIATNPSASAADLAGGIYVALMTTLLGLVVAIPSSIMFTILRGKVLKLLMALSIINGEVLDRFRSAGSAEE